MKKNHSYQLFIYKRSISLRIFFEFIIYSSIFAMIYFYTLGYLTLNQRMKDVDNSFMNLILERKSPPEFAKEVALGKANLELYNSNLTNTSEVYLPRTGNQSADQCYNLLLVSEQSKNLYDKYNSQCLDFLYFSNNLDKTTNKMIESTFFSIFLGTFWIFQILYLILLKRKVIFNFYYVIDIIIFICSLIYIVNYYGIIEYKRINNIPFKTSDVNYILASNFFSLTLLIFVLWLKFTYFLRMTRSLGIIIKIIELMILDLISFVIILIIDIFAFASLFFVLFKPYYSDFDTIFHSIRNLIGFNKLKIIFIILFPIIFNKLFKNQ